jgi:hypothetical protein
LFLLSKTSRRWCHSLTFKKKYGILLYITFYAIPNCNAVLVNKIFSSLSAPFSSEAMIGHIMSQDIFDNHRVQLCKNIINLYLKVRLHHEARELSRKDSYIRQKYTKLIPFKNFKWVPTYLMLRT